MGAVDMAAADMRGAGADITDGALRCNQRVVDIVENPGMLTPKRDLEHERGQFQFRLCAAIGSLVHSFNHRVLSYGG